MSGACYSEFGQIAHVCRTVRLRSNASRLPQFFVSFIYLTQRPEIKNVTESTRSTRSNRQFAAHHETAFTARVILSPLISHRNGDRIYQAYQIAKFKKMPFKQAALESSQQILYILEPSDFSPRPWRDLVLPNHDGLAYLQF